MDDPHGFSEKAVGAEIAWNGATWVSFDEARAMGVPEQTLQDALCETDRCVFGTSFQKRDPQTGVWMRVDPRDVRVTKSGHTPTEPKA